MRKGGGATHPLFYFEVDQHGFVEDIPMGPIIRDMSGVLLAGGKSRRMGSDKRFLELGGQTLLLRALSIFELLFSEILLVVAEPTPRLSESGHRIVTDLFPNRGSMGGLYTGLSYATSLRVFTAACDMPFLDPAVIRFIATLNDENDMVIPRLQTGLQPMHACYSKKCLPYIREMITTNNLRIHELAHVPGLSLRVVAEEDLRSLDPHLLSFLNVNRPADLELARKLCIAREKRTGGNT